MATTEIEAFIYPKLRKEFKKRQDQPMTKEELLEVLRIYKIDEYGYEVDVETIVLPALLENGFLKLNDDNLYEIGITQDEIITENIRAFLKETKNDTLYNKAWLFSIFGMPKSPTYEEYLFCEQKLDEFLRDGKLSIKLQSAMNVGYTLVYKINKEKF
ncbi:MAG: hypothetical protein ACLTMR_14795 [Faecalibacillus sp.]|nr:MAG TPA: hypothetical protein [Caudoviricetes sp.]